LSKCKATFDTDVCHNIKDPTKMTLIYNNEKLNNLCKLYKIDYLALFGSYAREEADENSDIDLLVKFQETPSLLAHVGIENHFSENVFNNKKVDLVTTKSLNKYIEPYVKKDLKVLYKKHR
jgi:predicted nucleotidyltransferase